MGKKCVKKDGNDVFGQNNRNQKPKKVNIMKQNNKPRQMSENIRKDKQLKASSNAINLNQKPAQIQEITQIVIDEETQAAIDAALFNSRNSDLLFRHCLRVCGIEQEDKLWSKDCN